MNKKEHLKTKKEIERLFKEIEASPRDAYEKMTQIEALNDLYLKEFHDMLKEQGLSKKTIAKHIDNVDLFISDYLLYRVSVPIFDCAFDLMDYFGYWYIRKCLFASRSDLLSKIASTRKFFLFMGSRGYIEEKVCLDALSILKSQKEYWLEELDDYLKEIYGEEDLDDFECTEDED